MRTVVVDKIASVTQACGLGNEVRVATENIPAEEGVVVVVEILTNKSTLPWLLQKIPSILVGRAAMMADRMQEQMEERRFTEVLVMQTFRPTTADGDFQLRPEDRLPKGFELEFLAEHRMGTRITRISRLVCSLHMLSAPLRV